MRSQLRPILLTAFTTVLAAEVSISPFSGDAFRFGLGSSVLLLSLLLFPYISWFLTGLVTSSLVLVFRVGLDRLLESESYSFLYSLQTHLPSAFYYLIFAVGLRFIRREDSDFVPFRFGIFIALVDVLANMAEYSIRYLLVDGLYFQYDVVLYFASVAFFRSYFILGLYNSLSIHRLRALHAEQKKRMDQMLQIGSGLYGETLYLQKSMDDIEQITAKSYHLYRRLKESGQSELSWQALEISQQIHEVKKDSQRILAGLSNLVDRETVMRMSLSQVLEFVSKANMKYAGVLRKNVTISYEVEGDYSTIHYVPLLTTLNNLAANAVEAMEDQGSIIMHIRADEETTQFAVEDNGVGIIPEDLGLVFEAGFTTKYNDKGVAATGIGLSHVRDIVQSFHGEISIASRAGSTKFNITIPTQELKEGGD
ncbi:sensor histidine kinase [Ammoniphilus sp. YIM 78166]|uniref:sensor histidine kinase n=1 Tax=Ammoniphilus sp. YIM 78166 TaxID=1644106 RepID=UPI0010706896|nr:sensor histidine kinase [Ammoniphilus sp. YIM 78166]